MARTRVVSRIAHDLCQSAPRRALGAAWWDSIGDDFARQDERFELRQRDRLLVGATAVMDRGIRTFAASAVGALALPIGYHPGELRHIDEDRAHYYELVDAGIAEHFFSEPSHRVAIRSRAALAPLFKPKDGRVEDLEFDSDFVPSLPRLRDAWRRHGGNRRATARLWSHAGAARPTIVAIHGFGAEQSWINEWMLALPRLYQLGCNVMLMTLPFHGARRTRLSPFSGHGFFSGGLAWTNEAFAQGVHDFRVFSAYLRHERGVPRVGVTGISLGGCTAALIASVDKTLAFAVPNVPVTSLADLMLEWRPLSVFVRALLSSTGMKLSELRHLLAVSSPLSWQPMVPADNLMLIGGVGDRVTPPKHTRLLWEHWDRCRLHWFPGGHVLHLDKGEYLIEMGRFLRDVDFLPRRSG